MKFSWIYEKKEKQQIKYFLKEQGVSKGLLAKVKFQGGKIEVNGQKQNVLFELSQGSQLIVTIPDERAHETLIGDCNAIDIIYEDAHFLIVNKPVNVPSIPAQYHPSGTMANRVKGYYQKQGYKDQVVHVVTRLDRDTTGLMLFAKHGFAHALLDQQLREKKVIKVYQALVGGNIQTLQMHTSICLPIGRDYTSLLKRKVTEEGQYAKTEYWLEKKTLEWALVRIQLHTGRTHQIRVHFEALGCPLLGDEMYKGNQTLGIARQALHCCALTFQHPFTKKMLNVTLPLPDDMIKIVGS